MPADGPTTTETATAALAGFGPTDLQRGTNQTGVRIFNERLVLALIRRHGSQPKAEIARLTGLSAQTISVIMKQLEADGFLARETPQRGRIGQPSIPFSLSPEGAFSIGLKIGRRSADLVLIDFVGGVRSFQHETYPYPTPAGILDTVRSGLGELQGRINERQAARVCGLGIAMPFELWNWGDESGAPPAVLEEWRDFDMKAEIAGLCPWPVHLFNDATAACAAELVFGVGHQYHDYLYAFIGSFIGGGVVLDGNLFAGRSGNAGALGSMPVPGPDGGAATQQLIRSASIHVLEKRLVAAGEDPGRLWASPDDWGDIGPVLDHWVEEVSANLAIAIVSAISIIDFHAVIIDGAVPAAVRRSIVERTAQAVAALDLQGLAPVEIVEGTIGSAARAIGGACLPLLANFASNRNVMFKGGA